MRVLVILLVLGIANSVFGQDHYDAPKSASQISIVLQKKQIVGTDLKMYVRLGIQNNSGTNKFYILSSKNIATLETNKMDMYNSCGKGCVTVYKFTGKNSFYVLSIPSNSNVTLDSLVLEGYTKNDNPTSVHVTITDALVIGQDNFGDQTKNDPLTDKLVNAIFKSKSKQYEKEVRVTYTSQTGPPSPLVVLMPEESDVDITGAKAAKGSKPTPPRPGTAPARKAPAARPKGK